MDTLQLVVREAGVRGLWRGTGPTVWRLSIGVGINMLVLEKLKAFMLQHVAGPGDGLGHWQAAVVGGARAGRTAWRVCVCVAIVGRARRPAAGTRARRLDPTPNPSPPRTPGGSRALSAAIMSPVTLVKTRMEYGGPGRVPYRSTLHALTSVARAEGVAGLFRGLGPTVLTNAPFSALYYVVRRL